jgi:hypothetical protein
MIGAERDQMVAALLNRSNRFHALCICRSGSAALVMLQRFQEQADHYGP